MTNTVGPPTVVVGVKNTAKSREAIRLAVREAGYRGAGLIAIMAYSADRALGAPAGRPLAALHSADEDQQVAEAALRNAVVDALGDQAEGVALQVLPGKGGRVLVEVARKLDAELIVMASRKGGTVPTGTVSPDVLRRTPAARSRRRLAHWLDGTVEPPSVQNSNSFILERSGVPPAASRAA